MGEHDPVGVRADDQLIECLRNGGTPPDPTAVGQALARWWRDVHSQPLPDWTPIYERVIREGLFDRPLPAASRVGEQPATTMLPAYPPIHALIPPSTSGFQDVDGAWYARVSAADIRGHVMAVEHSQNGLSVVGRSGITVYTVPGTAVKLPLRTGPVGELLAAFASRWHRQVEPLVASWCWGWAVRTVRGSTSVISNHASGSAVDLNAPRHVLGTPASASFSPAQIATIHRLLADFGGALRWGGDYSGRTDPMHIEAVVSEAACALVLARLTAPALKPSPTPTPIHSSLPEDDPVAPISINVRPDGRFNATAMAEVGSTSAVVAQAWVSFGSTWGSTHFKVCALDDTGAVMPGVRELDVANNRRAFMELPSGAVMVTVEGHTLGAASVPAAALVCKPKP